MKPALKTPPPGFDEMSTNDQLDYVAALWARMLAVKETLPVPDWHRQVVAERVAEYRAGEAGDGREWNEVQKDPESQASPGSMKKLILLPRAEAELFDAAIWYENEREGLGVAFEDDFDRLAARICTSPRQFPEIEPQVRRALFNRFPYAVFFLVEEDAAVVQAILHQHRDPNVWRSRFRSLG